MQLICNFTQQFILYEMFVSTKKNIKNVNEIIKFFGSLFENLLRSRKYFFGYNYRNYPNIFIITFISNYGIKVHFSQLKSSFQQSQQILLNPFNFFIYFIHRSSYQHNYFIYTIYIDMASMEKDYKSFINFQIVDKHKAKSFSSFQEAKKFNQTPFNNISKKFNNNHINRNNPLSLSNIKDSRFTQMNNSCPRLMRSQQKSKQGFSSIKKSDQIQNYNKWYIKPEARKNVLASSMRSGSKYRSKTQSYQFYNNLYDQYSADKQKLFNGIKSKNPNSLDNISIDNVVVLEKFKEQLQKNRKRVPKIVNVFLQRKFKQIQTLNKK